MLARLKVCMTWKVIWYSTQTGYAHNVGHYDQTRYHMLNLHSFFEGKGVEFRLFQFDNFNPDAPAGKKGGLHAGQLKAYVQLCLAMNYRVFCILARPSTSPCKAITSATPCAAGCCAWASSGMNLPPPVGCSQTGFPAIRHGAMAAQPGRRGGGSVNPQN